jgi:hypothetical protein
MIRIRSKEEMIDMKSQAETQRLGFEINKF